LAGLIENDVDLGFARSGILFAKNFRSDFDEITFERATIPLREDVGKIFGFQPEDIF
jgi:hypothetical protein